IGLPRPRAFQVRHECRALSRQVCVYVHVVSFRMPGWRKEGWRVHRRGRAVVVRPLPPLPEDANNAAFVNSGLGSHGKPSGGFGRGSRPTGAARRQVTTSPRWPGRGPRGRPFSQGTSAAATKRRACTTTRTLIARPGPATEGDFAWSPDAAG